MFLEHTPEFDLMAVPDPYYDGEKGYAFMLNLVEAASKGLLN
jgi:protein-tyrosine phosphatase